jgi:uncharacterized protein (DUF362 family)
MSTQVAIVRGDDPDKLVAETIGLLGGIEKFVTPGDVVLIKPNSFAKQVPANGNVVRPEIVIALARMVRDAGAKRVVVGERNDGPVLANFKDTGIEKVAELMPFDSAEHATVTVPNAEAIHVPVTVAKILLDCDKHITVPVAKTHCGAGVTACLKNAMGLMIGSETTKSHAYGICNVPIDINSLKWPVLGLADMTISQEGNFPGAGGVPVRVGVVVAGSDIVAVDATCARIMGYDPNDVWIIRNAARRNKGVLDEASIEIVGESLAAASHPMTGVVFDPTEFGDRVNFCVDLRCRYCAQDATSFLRTADGQALLEKFGRINIVAGPVRDPNIDPTAPTIIVGNCNAWMMDGGAFAHGCPPAVWQIGTRAKAALK